MKKKNCKLENLELKRYKIDHVGIKFIMEALMNENCKLKELNIQWNNISQDGTKLLAKSINHNNCKIINKYQG